MTFHIANTVIASLQMETAVKAVIRPGNMFVLLLQTEEIILAEQLPETQPELIYGKRFAYRTLFDGIAPADDVKEPIQYEEPK